MQGKIKTCQHLLIIRTLQYHNVELEKKSWLFLKDSIRRTCSFKAESTSKDERMRTRRQILIKKKSINTERERERSYTRRDRWGDKHRRGENNSTERARSERVETHTHCGEERRLATAEELYTNKGAQRGLVGKFRYYAQVEKTPSGWMGPMGGGGERIA